MRRSSLAVVAAAIVLSACTVAPAGSPAPKGDESSSATTSPALRIIRIDLGRVTGRHPRSGHVAVRGAWGSGTRQFGIDRSSGVGPTTFDIASDGRIVVADQENRRFVIVDGERRHNLDVSLPRRFMDVALTESALNLLVINAGPGGTDLLGRYDQAGALEETTRIGDLANNLRNFEGRLYLSLGSTSWRPLTPTATALPECRRQRAVN